MTSRIFSRAATVIAAALIGQMSVLGEDGPRRDFGPKISPDGSKIAFYSYQGDSTPELYVIDADGSKLTRLTRTDGFWEILPRWSPDGSRIYYTAGPSMGATRIYSMKADGSDVRAETDPEDGWGDGDAALPGAEGGNKMVFSRGNATYGQRIMVQDLDTGEARTIMSLNIENAYASRLGYHPDGTRVLFTASFGVKESPRPYELYSLDIETGRASQITYTPDIWKRQAAWARSGEHILYANDQAGSFDIYRIPAAGGPAERLSFLQRSHELFSDLRGNLLVFDAGRYPEDEESCIYAADADGSNLRRLTGHCLYHEQD